MFLQYLRSATGEPRKKLKGSFQHEGGCLWSTLSAPSGGDTAEKQFLSNLCLYENGCRLTPAHQSHASIRLGGAGRYSHWHRKLFFSTSDGSDPNINGREYSYDFSLTPEMWERDSIALSALRWNYHSDGRRFLERGGDRIPPPLFANLSLTNKCNLRCEICGSQKHLDNTGIRRRHMDFSTFEAVAETLFPLLSLVELNSQGDPLLHPRIEDVFKTIDQHRCELKVQHNGTLLRAEVIDVLLRQYGTVMLSLDAVGSKFDEVRRGGVWSKAEPGLNRFLRERNPRRLSVGVYPTWTARTIGEAINVVNWCAERDVDVIGFHRYWPVQGSDEQCPTDSQYKRTVDTLRRWCSDNRDRVRIIFEGECLNISEPTPRRIEYRDARKSVELIDGLHTMFPAPANLPGADPLVTCAAPNKYVEIGLEGQIGVCCRAQEIALGYATSVEKFADAWFGRNYELIRQSLRRGATGRYPLPNCEACVKFYAPSEEADRRAVDYSKANSVPDRLRLSDDDEIVVEAIQKEEGFCHIVVFPLGIGTGTFELFDDDRRLGPSACLHDDIRKLGAGRYNIGAQSLYFSTPDGSDPRRNGRTYSLRRKNAAKSAM